MKIDFLFYQPDKVYNINQIIFGILSPERILEMSSCEIYRHVTGNNKDQPGTQSDSRLGVIERGRICQTCLNDYNNCPGHMGHINLAKPIFHPLYLTTILMKLLTMICFRCSRLIVSPQNSSKLNQIKAKIPKARFALVKQLIEQEKRQSSCSHCLATLPFKIRKHPNLLSKIVVIYENESENRKEKSYNERLINPEIVLSILKGIPDDDLISMGFDPKLSRPEWMIWTVMPFPPITVRPPAKLDIGRYGDDDLTAKLNDISKTNNNIKINMQKIESSEQLEQIDYLWEILQQHISTYIDNESNDKKAVTRSGRPLKALVQRIKSKEGRVRWNLMGKRVDDSGRTVITPDNNINIDEIGIPIKIAINLVKPEFVTAYNINFLQTLVYNGIDRYPGAKYIVPKGSKFKKPLKVMDQSRRQQIKLAIGDVVYRNLLDGDWVLVNRQPSLHRMSMMAHKVVILKGETFRLNAQSITPYNADFDGDEMNIHVPQSLESENELSRLSHLATQIISPKNSLPIMGLVQDGLLGLYIFGQHGFLSVKNTMKMLNDLGNLADHNYHSTSQSHLITSSQDILNNTLPKITVFGKNRSIANDTIQYGHLSKGKIIESEQLKSGRTGLFHITWSDYGPNVARRLFDNLARISTNWLLIGGFSIGILDCIPNKYIKTRIHSIVNMFDQATQYLVDYQQLRSLPSIDFPDQCDLTYVQLVEKLTNLIKKEGHTYNNKTRVEQLMSEIYYPLIINRLIFETYRLEQEKDNFQSTHVNSFVTKNFNMVLEYWCDPEKGFINNIIYKFEVDIQTKQQYNKLVDMVKLIRDQYNLNYIENFIAIRQHFLSLTNVNLIDNGSMSETVLQQLEGMCSFIRTLIYIVPGSFDMSDRLEEKLYELTQQSTNIVNGIISDNIGFYQYLGLDKSYFNYIGNAFRTMYLAKSKGDNTNIGQIAGLLGQQDNEGKRQGNFFYRRSLPHYPKDSIEPKSRGYIHNSFLDGLNTLEYYAHAQSGRLNQIDKTIKTAETGYLQRKLIKMMENLIVHYDGTVRNSAKNVIQKLYGGDSIDPQQLENILIDIDSLRGLSFSSQELEQLKNHLSDDIVNKIDSNPDSLQQINQLYYTAQKDCQLLEYYYNYLGKLDNNIYAFLPVNFERLVHNNYYRYQIDKSDKKSDLDPLYIVSKIKQLIERLESSMVLNAHDHLLLFNLALYSNLSIKKLIIEYRYTRQAFDTLLEDIYLKYCRSLIAPGESIGIISAQSIGEPLTQMTLNKFHSAGVGKARSKLQGGVPRLTELLGLTRKEKMKTPSMTMKVSDYYLLLNKVIFEGTSHNVDINTINMLKSFDFKALILSSEICYDPNNERPRHKLDNYYVMDNQVDGRQKVVNDVWVIYFQLKIDKKRELRTDIIYNSIDHLIRNSNKYKTDKPNYSIQVSYDGMTDPSGKLESYVIIRCNSNLFIEENEKRARCNPNNILCYLIDLKNDIMKINIKGMYGISDVFVEKEDNHKTILTIGSSLYDIINNPVYSQVVDINKLMSNDVLEIEQLYGIEAARCCFVNEMYTTLSSDMNIRHLELLVDNMSHLGELLSVNRFGVKRGNNEPLHRASFEETTKQFIDSSIHTEHDPMRGPSANVMFGQFITSGTNSFSIVLDTEKLAQLEPVQNWEKMDIDPFNKRAVDNIIINNTSRLKLEHLIIADLFNFKFSI